MVTKNLKWYHPCLFIFALIILGSCANQLPPSGGPKDSAPPEILSSIPENLTTNFSSADIRITFNEFIQLDDPFNQIVISPPLPQAPKFRVKGKALHIHLNNPLQSNTTYSINFGDAIRDFNERNTLKNYNYVFSTGKWLDSLSISGKIFISRNNASEENILAVLHKDLSDTALFTKRPFYFTKTDKSGNFEIGHISAGTYRLYGLIDKNFNYRYDSKDESVGFVDTLIEISERTKQSFTLGVFNEISNKITVLEAYAKEPGKVQFVFSSGARTIKLDTEIYEDGDLAALSGTKDTLTYWTSNYKVKEATFFLTLNDTLKDTSDISLSYLETDSILNADHRIQIERRKSASKLSTQTIDVKDLFKPVNITLTRPVKSIDFDKIVLLEDTVKLKTNAKFNLNAPLNLTFSIDNQWKSGLDYHLIIPDSSMVDLFNMPNKRLSYNFKMQPKESYGNIILKVDNIDAGSNYVFELYNSKDKLVGSQTLKNLRDKKISFQFYLAGTYTLRIFRDDNQNGVWDTGDFKKRIQPEKVISFREKLALKSNWDMELDIRLQK